MTSDEERREVAARLRGIDCFHDEEGDVVDPHDVARALGLGWADGMWLYASYVDRLADLIDVPTTVPDPADAERREIARELRYQALYGEGATLSEWWARLQAITTGEDDFPDPRSLFMRLAGLIGDAACADEQSAEVGE